MDDIAARERPSAAPERPTFRPPVPVRGKEPLGRLALLMALRTNPLGIWREAHFEETFLGGKGAFGYGVFLADPAAIRHVLVDNVANYRKDDLQRSVLTPGLGEGLLTAEGDLWRRTRRTLAPLFTPRRVAALADAMRPPIEAFAERLARRRTGRVTDMAQEMTRVTFDVLAQTLFSGAIAGGAEAFGSALTRYFQTQGRIDPLDVIGAPAFLPRIGRIRARPALDFFERAVADIVAGRQALTARGAPPPDDLLSALLAARDPETGVGLTDLEVGANIVTFIGAGHETTANTLTWALYLLTRAPDIYAEVEREIDAAGDAVAGALGGDKLALTRAVIEEAMRLYPPVPSLSRTALEPDEVAGGPIPKGALVIIPPFVIHRHKRLWEEPDAFRPERFLPGARERIERFAYLPFGAGPRVCIGQQFAMVEAVMTLAILLRRLRFSYAGESEPSPVQRITLRPRDGMPMKIMPR